MKVITDLHFGARSNDLHILAMQNEFYTKFLDTVKQDEYIFILGDVFENRKATNLIILHSCKEFFFDKLHKLTKNVFIICGNHDAYYSNSNVINSVRNNLGGYSGWVIVDNEQYTVTVDGMEILLVPWLFRGNNFSVVDKRYDYIMGHFDFWSHPETKEYYTSKVNYYVLSGHIHNSLHEDKYIQVGDPYQLNFGEVYKHGYLEITGNYVKKVWNDINIFAIADGINIDKYRGKFVKYAVQQNAFDSKYYAALTAVALSVSVQIIKDEHVATVGCTIDGTKLLDSIISANCTSIQSAYVHDVYNRAAERCK